MTVLRLSLISMLLRYAGCFRVSEDVLNDGEFFEADTQNAMLDDSEEDAAVRSHGVRPHSFPGLPKGIIPATRGPVQASEGPPPPTKQELKALKKRQNTTGGKVGKVGKGTSQKATPIAKTRELSSCQNVEPDTSCDYWRGQGYCNPSSEFYGYVQSNCQKACDSCRPTPTPQPTAPPTAPPATTCSDSPQYSSGCPQWKAYCAKTSEWYQFMMDHCKSSCGACNSGSGPSTPSPPTSPTSVASSPTPSQTPRTGGSCPDTKPTHHYPLPSKTYTAGIPSGYSALPSGMSTCDLYGLQTHCVDKINEYRTGKRPFSDGRWSNKPSKPAFTMGDKDTLKCINAKALSDLKYAQTSGCGHYTSALDCGLGRGTGAENSCCPQSCDSVSSCKQMIDGCLQQMWDEGEIVLDTGAGWSMKTGHYYNMIGEATHVTCSFGFSTDGKALSTQNFF